VPFSTSKGVQSGETNGEGKPLRAKAWRPQNIGTDPTLPPRPSKSNSKTCTDIPFMGGVNVYNKVCIRCLRSPEKIKIPYLIDILYFLLSSGLFPSLDDFPKSIPLALSSSRPTRKLLSLSFSPSHRPSYPPRQPTVSGNHAMQDQLHFNIYKQIRLRLSSST
jgi:hypothetical protein